MKKLRILLILSIIQFPALAQVVTGLQSIDRNIYNNIAGNFPVTTVQNLPPRVDLSDNLPPVGNQNPQNSCVAWAIAYAAQSFYAKAGVNNWNFYTPSGTLNPGSVFSPSYLYNQINNGVDQGSNFYHALLLLKDQGVATMRTMPYSHFTQQPGQQARQEAANYKIKSFRRLGESMDPLLDAKDQLAQGHPIIINARTDITYFDWGFLQNRPSPFIWSSVGNIKPGLNHALLLVGYDEGLRAFKFVNSWGPNWGDKGFGWISYSIYNNIVSEAFTMQPSFGVQSAQNLIVNREKNTIDAADRNAGLNLILTGVAHMNSNTHPQIPFNQRFMHVEGVLSIPANVGITGQVMIYFYKRNANGTKGAAIGSLLPVYSLLNGNVATATPPLPLNNNSWINLPWYANIHYTAFNLPFGTYAPLTSYVIAEPALLIDNYPVRFGQSFIFTITQ